MAAPGAQGSKNGFRAFFGSQEAVFGAVFLDYIKRVTALQASLDYQSQPTTGKSPKKSPEESSYRRNHGRVIVSVIAKSMTKSKATASLELSGLLSHVQLTLIIWYVRGLSQKFVDNMDNFVQTCGKIISRPQLFCPLY